MAAKKNKKTVTKKPAPKKRSKTVAMDTTLDHEEYARQQKVLVHAMIQTIHASLSDLGVKKAALYDGTSGLAFSLCTLLDLFTGGLEVSPHLGFALDDGTILTDPSGSWLHSLVHEEIDQALDA